MTYTPTIVKTRFGDSGVITRGPSYDPFQSGSRCVLDCLTEPLWYLVRTDAGESWHLASSLEIEHDGGWTP